MYQIHERIIKNKFQNGLLAYTIEKDIRPDVETVWKNSEFLPWNFTQELCILMFIRIPDETFHWPTSSYYRELWQIVMDITDCKSGFSDHHWTIRHLCVA